MKYDFDLENRRENRKQFIKKALLLILEIGVVVFLAFFITHYGMVAYTVSGQSMSPTLQDKDKVLINKMSYKIHSVRRNDVILVEQSGAEHSYYTLERVIGLPGEKITIKNGCVYINGKKYSEKYAFETMENGGLALETVTLDEGEYFVLCDNRNNGEDSRNANVGNVTKDQIVGKAWFCTTSMELVSYIDGFEKQKKAGASASPAVKNTK